MRASNSLPFFPLLLLGITAVQGAGFNERALRTLMTDSRFVGLVSPCTAGGSARTTAGEWLRTAFHDAGSHDAGTGQGGLDGSIAFEVDYAENFGAFVPATLAQYRLSQQAGVTLSDLITLGAITAVASCGGPSIPFYPGRLDARSAAPEGSLPLPEQKTSQHESQFARMGFSRKEMIALVACGHTIGGVHRVNNPAITSATNAAFDSTRTVFDNSVARQYTTGNLTNPLAQPIDPLNLATSSDTRVFSSDGNTTIARYAASQEIFYTDCVSVFGRMFNDAIPRGTPLSSTPLIPFPVTIGFRTNLRNGAYHLQTGSARLWGMEGKWTSFDVIYTTRDGARGTDGNLLFVRALRGLNDGGLIEVKDFTTRSPGVDPLTGIRSVSVVLTLNDGSTYTSSERTEVEMIDDRIAVDVHETFTCIYTSPSGQRGLNLTAQVLGPLDPRARVELLYDFGSDTTRTTFGQPILMKYRREREGTPFLYYNVFIEDLAAADIGNYAIRITRSDGTSSLDNRQGIYYPLSTLNACVAGAEIPVALPQPSQRRRLTRRSTSCAVGLTLCGSECKDTMSDLQSCGACPGEEGSVDCSELGEEVQCIQGVCVVAVPAPVPSTTPRKRFGKRNHRY